MRSRCAPDVLACACAYNYMDPTEICFWIMFPFHFLFIVTYDKCVELCVVWLCGYHPISSLKNNVHLKKALLHSSYYLFFTKHTCIHRRVRQRCTNVHPQFAGTFRSHVIGGEPIAINRAQILTPSCYWEFHRQTQFLFMILDSTALKYFVAYSKKPSSFIQTYKSTSFKIYGTLDFILLLRVTHSNAFPKSSLMFYVPHETSKYYSFTNLNITVCSWIGTFINYLHFGFLFHHLTNKYFLEFRAQTTGPYY